MIKYYEKTLPPNLLRLQFTYRHPKKGVVGARYFTAYAMPNSGGNREDKRFGRVVRLATMQAPDEMFIKEAFDNAMTTFILLVVSYYATEALLLCQSLFDGAPYTPLIGLKVERK